MDSDTRCKSLPNWKLTTSLVLFSTLLAFSSHSFSQNLVTNPGFESGTTGWTLAEDASAQFTESSGRSGNRLTHYSSAATYTAETTQTVSGLSAGTYRLSLYTVGGATSGAWLWAYCDDQNFATTIPSAAWGNWTQVTVDNISVSGGGSCKLGITTENSEWSSFDDVVFEQVSGGGGGNAITVRASGTSGAESISLQVGGTTVETWTLSTSMQNYEATTELDGEIRVAYTNDASGRDARVDYIQVNGATRQAEDQSTNTGVWQDGGCGGGGHSEVMHCNGFISFGATNATYYVDSVSGDDSNTGLDESRPWKSLSKINATTFSAGDKILLKAGGTWTGQLWPKGSGAAGSPIVIDSYGSGAMPRINGAGRVGDAVRLFNQEYWTIRNLEVTNTAPSTGTAGENLGDFRGIHVSGNNSRTLSGFVIDGVYVHDVTGEVNWIGGDTSNNRTGITFKTGWDTSKKTGGIVFDTTVPNIASPPSTPTILNDVTIQNSRISNTSFAGISIKQYTGSDPGAVSTGWGSRSSSTDTKFKPHTNFTIRNNYVTQANTPYGCNGIYVTGVRGGLVEYNVVEKVGTSGIETYFADKVTIQFNEVFDTAKKAGGADSNGIDADKATTDQIIQYNYVHGNGDGILLCQFSFGDVVVRYNVITSNTRYQIYLHSDAPARAQIYNNTFYNDASNYLIYGYGKYMDSTYVLRNNIFYSTRSNAVLSNSSTVTYSHNLYGGASLTVPSEDSRAVVANPQFVSAPINAPSGTAASGPALAAAHELKVAAGSPAVNAGASVASNGGRDYEGNALYNDAPDIGAFEQPGDNDSATRYEAEASSAVCMGTIDTNWSGYSGSGFCNGDNAVDAYAQFTVDASTAGTATVSVRFANGATTDRPANLVVNGATVQTVSFPGTGSWNTWATKTVTVSLAAGSNTIRLSPTMTSGLANIDYLDVEVTSTPEERYEAESSSAVCTGTIDTNHAGYSGSGFCNGDNAIDADAWFTVNASSAGTATVSVGFANGATTDRPADLVVNGSTVQTVSFPGTGAWSTWDTRTVTVSLDAGSNTIQLSPTTSAGLANIDYLDVTAP